MNQEKKKELKPWLNDVAVLSIFFARPDVFAKSFARIKEARPRVLLLWQDGPREGRPDDIKNIEECRKIAADIDWECEVHTNYHEKNMGCDPSTHYAHKWAFTIVDKCIILEDDIVPSMSFFPFCKELLDKYENDQRIDRICGFNIMGEYPADGDYLFARYGSSIGWATWKRVADTWETEYDFMNNEFAMNFLEKTNKRDGSKISVRDRLQREKAEGIPYWEMVTGIRSLLNSGLIIYPKRNLISNVGLGVNSTHTPDNIAELPKELHKFYFNKTYEYEFPLKHPKYIYSEDDFLKDWAKSVGTPIYKRMINKLIRSIKRFI